MWGENPARHWAAAVGMGAAAYYLYKNMGASMEFSAGQEARMVEAVCDADVDPSLYLKDGVFTAISMVEAVAELAKRCKRSGSGQHRWRFEFSKLAVAHNRSCDNERALETALKNEREEHAALKQEVDRLRRTEVKYSHLVHALTRILVQDFSKKTRTQIKQIADSAMSATGWEAIPETKLEQSMFEAYVLEVQRVMAFQSIVGDALKFIRHNYPGSTRKTLEPAVKLLEEALETLPEVKIMAVGEKKAV